MSDEENAVGSVPDEIGASGSRSGRDEDISLIAVSASNKGDKTFMPIIISKRNGERRKVLTSDNSDGPVPGQSLSSGDGQLTRYKSSVPRKDADDLDTMEERNNSDEDGTYKIPSWNAFSLSDPNAQLTVKSITSVGLGSTDGRNLYVRRVPSSASILISNPQVVRR